MFWQFSELRDYNLFTFNNTVLFLFGSIKLFKILSNLKIFYTGHWLKRRAKSGEEKNNKKSCHLETKHFYMYKHRVILFTHLAFGKSDVQVQQRSWPNLSQNQFLDHFVISPNCLLICYNNLLSIVFLRPSSRWRLFKGRLLRISAKPNMFSRNDREVWTDMKCWLIAR